MIVTKNIEVIRFLRTRLSSLNNRPESTTPYSDRLIYEALRVARAQLIFQKTAQRMPLNLQNYQTIPCIPLEEVPVSECPCAPNSGCTFLATKFDMPTTIGNFYSVSSIDGSISYSYVPWDRFGDKLRDRYATTSGGAYFTTKNTKNGIRGFLYNDIHKENITPTAIYANPIEIYKYPNCDGTEVRCPTPLQYPFPVDPDLLPSIYEMATQLLQPLAPADDKINNASDDSKGGTPLK